MAFKINHHKPDVTFPIATADVAMSRTKLSPFLAGAAKLIGLVPKVHYNQPQDSTRMKDYTIMNSIDNVLMHINHLHQTCAQS